jgi:hypothetical protein
VVQLGKWGPACSEIGGPDGRRKKNNLNLNLTIQKYLNLIHSESNIPGLKFFEIKYGFEGFDERNNFLHRNVFKFEVDVE